MQQNLFEDIVLYTIEVYSLFLLADFLSGVIHWWQDRYGNPEWKFLGKVIIPNLIHHKKPRIFLKYSYLQRNGAAIVLSVLFSLLIWALPFVGWHTALVLFIFGSQTVEIHAMSHRTDKQRPRIFTFLQKCRIIQTPEHHWGRHHRAPYTGGYCLMTNLLNPILDRLKVWKGLEFIIFGMSGILPRDETVRLRTKHKMA